MKLEVASISAPRRGEDVNGDAVVIRQEGTLAMVCVIDALGHGRVAHGVAERASVALHATDIGTDPGQVLRNLHEALRGSRGAAATLLRIDGTTITGAGVGNVDVRWRGGNLSPVLSPGVLGGLVRHFRVFDGSLRAGARVVLFSDGISRRFEIPSPTTASADRACRLIYDGHRRETDDATVVVVDAVE